MFELTKLPEEVIFLEFGEIQDPYARGGGIYTQILLINNTSYQNKKRIYYGLTDYNYGCLKTYLEHVSYYNHALKEDSVSEKYGDTSTYILMRFNHLEAVILNTDRLTFHQTKELMCRLALN